MAFQSWTSLLTSIARRECVLFLGPELPAVGSDGASRTPADRLADRLLHAIDGGAASPNGGAGRLADAAQRFLRQSDEFDLETEVTAWHRELRETRSRLHDDLAALPWRWIVTTGLDPLMETALRAAGRPPAVERYNYRGDNKRLLAVEEPTDGSPVLFHLYGHTAEPPSLVLAETQLLAFLESLISGDPPLPVDLREALTNSRRFLFLGFGLDRWYLRVLLHVLKVLRGDSRCFAFESLPTDSEATAAATVLFYRENFNVDVQALDLAAFASELRERYVPGEEEEEVASQPKPLHLLATSTVFICHAHENADWADQIRMALERYGLEPWLDKEALRGGERWDDLIEATIEEVDYVVVVNSRALADKARQKSYVNKEIRRALKAEEMHLESRFILPVTIDDAPLLRDLAPFMAIDLRQPDGLQSLVRAIKSRMRGL